MTLAELAAATGLTANDLIGIWDAEASGSTEPTQKLTAQQLAAAVKVLADLVGTAELAEKQDKLTFDTTPTTGSNNPVTSGGVADAITQSTANIGTIVFNSANKTIAFTGGTKEVCGITLAPGVWVMYANIQFQGATVGQRQGGTIAISNADGCHNPECYSMLSLNDTMNHYVNMCYIVKVTDATNYYLMAYDTTTRSVIGTIKAVRII